MADESFPSFPFYPRDWIAATALMTPEQKGAYIDLLAYAWEQTPACALPDDEGLIAKLAGIPLARWRKIGGPVRAKFTAGEDGMLRNGKQVKVYGEACEHRERRRKAGALGNEKKAAKRTQSERKASRNASRNAHASTSTSFIGDTDVSPSWSAEACEDWVAALGGTANGGKIGKALKPLVKKYGWEEVRPLWKLYLSHTDAEYASPANFAERYGAWKEGRIGKGKGKHPQNFDYSNATDEWAGEFTA